MRRRRRGGQAFSLLAFQDIITSVTGTMILVTVLIAIELMQRQEGSPRHRTNELVDQLERQLRETKDSIEEMKKQVALASSPALDEAMLDETTLRTQLQDVDRKSDVVREDAERLDATRQRADARLESLRQSQSDRSSEVTEIARLKAELQEKKDQLAKITSSKRVVYDSADGSASTKWIVEVDGTGFRAARMGVSEKPVAFGSEAEFKAWVAQRSSDYFFLLLKPNAVRVQGEIADFLDEQRAKYGFDLIDTDESPIDPVTGAAA